MSGSRPGGDRGEDPGPGRAGAPARVQVVGIVQSAERPLDVLVGGIGGEDPHAGVADEAVAELDQAAVAVLALDPAIAFAHPEGGVVAAAALLDHQQLAHGRSRLIRGPRCSNPLAP
jgi:hypothetical protein